MNKQEIEKAIRVLKCQINDLTSTLTEEPQYPFRSSIETQIESTKLAISALEQQLNGGWIFCEDRMPNVDNIMVLIQDKYGDLALAIYKDGNFYFLNHTNTMLIKGSKIKNVVAWHFLPKPWEDNNDE